MNLIAIFGAGLLVGAALIVIVPEGMMVLFESMINENVTIKNLSLTQIINDNLKNTVMKLHGAEGKSNIIDHNAIKYIGLSLIIGFTSMLVLDQGFLIVKENRLHKHKAHSHHDHDHHHQSHEYIEH